MSPAAEAEEKRGAATIHIEGGSAKRRRGRRGNASSGALTDHCQSQVKQASGRGHVPPPRDWRRSFLLRRLGVGHCQPVNP